MVKVFDLAVTGEVPAESFAVNHNAIAAAEPQRIGVDFRGAAVDVNGGENDSGAGRDRAPQRFRKRVFDDAQDVAGRYRALVEHFDVEDCTQLTNHVEADPFPGTPSGNGRAEGEPRARRSGHGRVSMYARRHGRWQQSITPSTAPFPSNCGVTSDKIPLHLMEWL